VGLRAGGIAGLAVGALVGAGLVTVGLVLDAERIWPGAMRLRWKVVAGWLVALPLPLLKAHPLLWLGWAAVVAAAVAWTTCLRPASTGHGAAAPAMPQGGRRLRILHLAFEDHRRPGSGGGAIRVQLHLHTREINRRLA
jgi:hypothetical protein